MVHAKAWMKFFVNLLKTGQVFKVALKLLQILVINEISIVETFSCYRLIVKKFHSQWKQN